MLYVFAGLYIYMGTLWFCYLAIMNLKRNQARLSLMAKLWAYPGVAFCYTLDFLFNVGPATLCFAEMPNPKRMTFSARCSYHIEHNAGNWRGMQARWWCRTFLDPFDPDGKHCG